MRRILLLSVPAGFAGDTPRLPQDPRAAAQGRRASPSGAGDRRAPSQAGPSGDLRGARRRGLGDARRPHGLRRDAQPRGAGARAETGTLKTLDPPLSPLVWTTMMTGVSPLEHGILDFTRRNPATGALEPIPSSERRVPAIWNMAADGDKSVAVFGLWATWPAEAVKGLLVADRFSSFTSRDTAPPPAPSTRRSRRPGRGRRWRRPKSCRGVRRPQGLPPLADREGVRRRPLAEPRTLRPSGQRAAPHPGRDAGLPRARHLLARARASRISPSSISRGRTPSATSSRPTRRRGRRRSAAEDFERFSRVPGALLRRDRPPAGRLPQARRGRGAVLMLASDHGFRWKEGRPASCRAPPRPPPPAGIASRGSICSGGRASSARPTGARGRSGRSAPPSSRLLGLPPGKGVAGPPLAGIDAGPRRARRLPGALPAGARGHRGRRRRTPRRSPSCARSATWAARKGSGGRRRGIHPHRRPPTTTRGCSAASSGETDAAAAAYGKALAVDPKSAAAMWNLSDLLPSQKKEPDRSDDLLVAALRRRPSRRGRSRPRPHRGLRPRRRERAGAAAPRPRDRHPVRRTPACISSAGATAWSATSARRRSTTSRAATAKPAEERPRLRLRWGSPASASATARGPPPASTARSRSIPTSRRSGARWGRSAAERQRPNKLHDPAAGILRLMCL